MRISDWSSDVCSSDLEYRALLFDHAKHAWCADPSRLSAPARAYFEPLWQDLAARAMAAMGPPALPLPGFDPEREAVLLELPTSGLISRRIGEEEGALLLIIRKSDLAAGASREWGSRGNTGV